MWIQRVSWIGLILALVGFGASLGIHLATFAGVNARLYLLEPREWVLLIEIPVIGAAIIAFLSRKRPVRGATPLPESFGTGIIVLAAALAVYAGINLLIGGWLWAPFPNTEDQLRQLRIDSSQWMFFFSVATRVIADYGLGLFRSGNSVQPMGR
jgi:hypothetical protein